MTNLASSSSMGIEFRCEFRCFAGACETREVGLASSRRFLDVRFFKLPCLGTGGAASGDSDANKDVGDDTKASLDPLLLHE
jgi:hypothetical protein